jgi:hypothetical protein
MLKFMTWCGLVLGLLCAIDARAQNGPVPGITDTYNHYQAIDTKSLSSAAETLTIQQPSSPGYTVVFESLWVRCSTSCAFTLSQNGSAASATTLAIVALNNSPVSSITAWKGSNSTGGVTLGTYYLEAAGTYALDMSKFQLSNAAGKNLTITTSSVTATVAITVQWTEK